MRLENYLAAFVRLENYLAAFVRLSCWETVNQSLALPYIIFYKPQPETC
jgi:hypothetical protein